MFITTLYFFFGNRDNDTAIILGALDMILMFALFFLGGRWLDWPGILLLFLFLLVANRSARAYFVWREKQRQELLKTPGWNGFSGSWIPYADLWADDFRGLGIAFIVVLILGKLSLLVL